jgi:uncharacterized protein HemX
MTTWTVILFAVALVWTLMLAVISVIFADKERKEREDLQKQKEALRYLEDKAEQRFKQRGAEIEDKVRILNREKEQFKERELNLAARRESILELEATLLNKQKYLAELEAKLKAGTIPIISEKELIKIAKKEGKK